MTEPAEIYVLGKKVRLLQPVQGFRTSLDSVMLAAACPAQDGERVLDMGCGVGGASFCLLYRQPGLDLTGLDIQQDYIDLANKNVAINGPVLKVSFLHCDIRQFDCADKDQRYDHAICNPPYLEAGHHMPSPHEGRAAALGHHELEMTLKDWVDAAFRLLKPRGVLTMIHRADSTDRIIQALGKRFGAVEIIPLWPKVGEPAKRVIIRAGKDRKSPATLYSGLVLHEEDGSYTIAADKILRHASAL